MTYIASLLMRSSVPKLRVKRLNPEFERAHHLGTISRRRAINRIELDAEFARDGQLRAVARSVGQGR